MLPVEAEHAAATESLPMHHQDPFDRLLLAQALNTPLALLTHDAVLAMYSDSVILV
jgi:PIN domain nuclease of toxin-antitoxin system